MEASRQSGGDQCHPGNHQGTPHADLDPVLGREEDPVPGYFGPGPGGGGYSDIRGGVDFNLNSLPDHHQEEATAKTGDSDVQARQRPSLLWDNGP